MSAAGATRVAELIALAHERHLGALAVRAAEAEPAELAEVLARLEDPLRLEVTRSLPPPRAAAALPLLAAAHSRALMGALDDRTAADLVAALPTTDAARLLRHLAVPARERILDGLAERSEIRRLLDFAPESVGARMATGVITVTETDTVGFALESVRRQAERSSDIAAVFVVDASRRLVGRISIRNLVVQPSDAPVRAVMLPATVRTSAGEGQEQAAERLVRHRLDCLPVLDADDRLIGTLSARDALTVLAGQRDDVLLRFAGMTPGWNGEDSWPGAIGTRLKGLYLTLLPAFLAAAVLYFFRSALTRNLALVVWMPLVAGMGGNAGTQALAAALRRLAAGQLPGARAHDLLRRELLLGMGTGAAIGLVVAGVAVLLGESWRFGLVLLVALVGNLGLAGIVGAALPVIARRFGIEPSAASSSLMATVADVVGFALLLALASAFLL